MPNKVNDHVALYNNPASELRKYFHLQVCNTLHIMGNKPSSPLGQCLTSAVGGNGDLVAFPSKPLYHLLDVHPYNLDVSVAPVAITYPRSADQVASIVKCAGSDYKVQARCGGHSYANYGKKYLGFATVECASLLHIIS
jgi:hypothetical protein